LAGIIVALSPPNPEFMELAVARPESEPRGSRPKAQRESLDHHRRIERATFEKPHGTNHTMPT